MTLSKEESLLLAFQQNKILANENRFKINSKIKTKCLKCFETIYIGYFNSSIKSIFCENHKSYANEKNVVQLQYLRTIKENGNKQLIK